jgi:hypothetical protein
MAATKPNKVTAKGRAYSQSSNHLDGDDSSPTTSWHICANELDPSGCTSPIGKHQKTSPARLQKNPALCVIGCVRSRRTEFSVVTRSIVGVQPTTNR